jgi:hypothetical protein
VRTMGGIKVGCVVKDNIRPKPDLKMGGWSKAIELAKVARRDRQSFDCATWLHKAKALPKEEFKREVDRHLTGKETEPWEILCFKAYRSQLSVVEMICADFSGRGEFGDREPGYSSVGPHSLVLG